MFVGFPEGRQLAGGPDAPGFSPALAGPMAAGLCGQELRPDPDCRRAAGRMERKAKTPARRPAPKHGALARLRVPTTQWRGIHTQRPLPWVHDVTSNREA